MMRTKIKNQFYYVVDGILKFLELPQHYLILLQQMKMIIMTTTTTTTTMIMINQIVSNGIYRSHCRFNCLEYQIDYSTIKIINQCT
jgi:hypothetical protein